jgi:hypothetical protein
MIRFLVGLVIGAGALTAVALFYTRGDGCLGRCGEGTRCEKHTCVVATNAPPVVVKEPPKRRRRKGTGALGEANAPPEVQLKPGDEKMIAQGDALGRPEHIDLSQPDGRELTQDDMDRVFHGANSAILRCISESIGDAPLESGKIEVGLRIERTGSVSRVRVEAPQLMQRNGLTRCVRPAVTALHFPSSGGAAVVTYPFELK